MNISFALTTPQFKARTKDVTRRLGWSKLSNRTILTAVEKGQGLKKGERVVKLGQIRVVSVRREPLNRMVNPVAHAFERYGQNEVIREGFPEMTPREFVEMFCRHNNCKPDRIITRIEFVYL